MRLAVGAGFCLQAAYVASRASLSSSCGVGALLVLFFGEGLRLLQLIYVGGCPRDFGANCPVGWVQVWASMLVALGGLVSALLLLRLLHRREINASRQRIHPSPQ